MAALTVYGIRFTATDDTLKEISYEDYRHIYTSQELAQKYINFSKTCPCNICGRITKMEIIPIIVVNELIINDNEDDDDEDQGISTSDNYEYKDYRKDLDEYLRRTSN